MSSSGKFMTKTIHILFYILFFLTPLVMWTKTSEVFEFNKMLFVYAMTILIGASWIIKSVADKKLEIVRTPLDLPLFLFFLSQLISTAISIDSHTSVWGYYSRFHGGLASTISYIFLYYALVTNFRGFPKATKNILYAILASSTLVCAYAILEHFGIDKHVWVQDVQNRVFSTLGQPNWLSAYLAAILPIPIFLAVYSKDKLDRIIHSTLAMMYLISILFTKSQSGIAATAVVLLVTAVVIIRQKKKTTYLLPLFAVIAAILIFKHQAVTRTLNSLNKINPFYSNSQTIIAEENKTRVGGSDSMTIRRLVWSGAIQLGIKHPLFGTGVETFGYTYYNVRPAQHNLVSESDFLYNKAHNEFLNIFANSGFFGLLTYLFLIAIIIKTLAKQGHKNALATPLLIGFISILITNFFGFSVVIVALYFFLFSAIILADDEKNNLSSIKIDLPKDMVYLATIIVAALMLNSVRKMWIADITYNIGRNMATYGYYQEGIDKLKKSIEIRPNEALYYAALGDSQTKAVLGLNNYLATASISADVKQQALTFREGLIQDALTNSAKAVALNPHHVSFQKMKASTELTLATIDAGLINQGINTLLRITEMSPTDSMIYYYLGNAYQSTSQMDKAEMAYKKAIELKPDNALAKNALDSLQKSQIKK